MKEAFTRKSLLILGRGIGQVMFQNNALSGLLMLIGIFLNSWQMGLLAVSGNIISTSTGRISGYDRDDIKNGFISKSEASLRDEFNNSFFYVLDENKEKRKNKKTIECNVI